MDKHRDKIIEYLLQSGQLLFGDKEELQKRTISTLSFDSRTVERGGVFFAIRGEKDDGGSYLRAAVSHGAQLLCCERGSALEDFNFGSPIIIVDDIRETLAQCAARYYQNPSEKLFSIAVTGTNGKTSVSWILAEALSLLNTRSAQIGTLGMRMMGGERFKETGVTTPDPLLLQHYFSQCVEKGIQALVMEVSSHGIAQKRISSIEWDSAVFTSFSRDHLDYHETIEEYERVKVSFFTNYFPFSRKNKKQAILNLDDPVGERIAKELKTAFPNIGVVGIRMADPKGEFPFSDYALNLSLKAVEKSFSHTTLEIMTSFGETLRIQTKLIGSYNIMNVLLAVGTLLGRNYPKKDIEEALPHVPRVPGRLEQVSEVSAVPVFIDYAHTPDALIRAQRALRELIGDSPHTRRKGRLITVFGCGGDRDRGKRRLMGEAVTQYSDVAVITSDNPRSEDPQAIIDEIIIGVNEASANGLATHHVHSDRFEAIAAAIGEAREGDVVLIAGKGHEGYQEIQGRKIPFSDKEVAFEILKEKQYVP